MAPLSEPQDFVLRVFRLPEEQPIPFALTGLDFGGCQDSYEEPWLEEECSWGDGPIYEVVEEAVSETVTRWHGTLEFDYDLTEKLALFIWGRCGTAGPSEGYTVEALVEDEWRLFYEKPRFFHSSKGFLFPSLLLWYQDGWRLNEDWEQFTYSLSDYSEFFIGTDCQD